VVVCGHKPLHRQGEKYLQWFVGTQPWRNQRRITRGGLWGHNHGATSEELLVVVCGDTTMAQPAKNYSWWFVGTQTTARWYLLLMLLREDTQHCALALIRTKKLL
jgi:hypothetical protein